MVNIFAAGAVGFFNGPQWRDLVTIGFADELLGVLLVASPELLPRLQVAWVWVTRRTRSLYLAAEAFIRQLLHRAPRLHSVSAGASMPFESSLGVNLIRKLPPEDASLEAKIDWLIERVKMLLERADKLDQELPGRFDQLRRDLMEQLSSVEKATKQALAELADRNIRLRLIGLVYVVLGLILSWAGNVA